MAEFRVTDRRGSRPGGGIILGESVSEAKRAVALGAEAQAALSRGRSGPAGDESRGAVARQMRASRKIAARADYYSGSDVSYASGRPRDPMFYWKQNNLPYDATRPDELVKIRAYCNTPDAPVLMADGTFKAIGEVQAGEEVMGWEWRSGSGGHARRYLRPSRVEAVQRRSAPMVVEATMESGRVVRCTPDHRWANYHYSPGYGESNEYEPLVRPSRGGPGGPVRHNTMSSLAEPVATLVEQKMVEAAGYLSGIIDADGTVTAGEVRIGQSPEVNGAICSRIEQALNVLGLDYRVSDRSPGVRLWVLKGTLENRLRLRAWMPWSVKVQQAWTDRREMRWVGGSDRVASVRELGPGEVVSMQTETGNYTAWGYASSNCRIIYQTHPVIASAIDIFSKYPLVGMEFTCKDKALTEFYTTLFFDQLNYEDFLIDVGREHWSVGEAWPLGSFNEDLGVWEDDELLNPDDVEMHRSPFLKEPRFLIRLPETLRRVLQRHEPAWEYQALMRSYPELAKFAYDDQARMPVSNVLLKQIKFKGDTFNPRGVPILMRGFRPIMQEEMLNAAQDAVASRLYTPLILARLGASATDLGTTQPWVPNEEDLMAFEDALDAALAADFRVLTHHFAVQMDSVFGREVVPNFDADFERLTERQLQVFGLSKTMLSGAGAGETYAADALNRDLISQLLTVYQRQVTRFVRDRMLVVAEAQEHYDYEVRGGKRYPVMEEVLEVDEETGEQRIVEQPKLLVPDLNLRAMNMRDDESQRQFYEALRASGVPISMRTRMVNVPIDLSDEIDQTREEQVELAVEAQETRRATYVALKAKNLPIPDDLREDFEPKAIGADGEKGQAAAEQRPALLGVDAPDSSALVPTPDVLATPPGQPLHQQRQDGATVIPLSRNKIMQPGRVRPPESDEMRAGMPRPAALVASAEGDEASAEEPPTGRLIDGPKHVGMRRYAQVRKDEPLGEDVESAATETG